jgi:hypothetical protein
LQAEATYLIPEVVSAVAQQDAGGNYLRQFVVISTCYDTISSTPASPGSGCVSQLAGPPIPTVSPQPAGHTGGRHQAHASPCPSVSPSLPVPSLPVPLPTVSLPLPTPAASDCPSPHRSATPKPGATSGSSGGLLGVLLSLLGSGL